MRCSFDGLRMTMLYAVMVSSVEPRAYISKASMHRSFDKLTMTEWPNSDWAGRPNAWSPNKGPLAISARPLGSTPLPC